MRFPSVTNCLLCEDIRPEGTTGKSTVIGFFGVLPHVSVYLMDLNAEVSFYFALLTGRVVERYEGTLQVEIYNSNGQRVVSVSGQNVQLAPGQSHILGLLVPPFAVRASGTCRFVVRADGDIAFESTFAMKHAAEKTGQPIS